MSWAWMASKLRLARPTQWLTPSTRPIPEVSLDRFALLSKPIGHRVGRPKNLLFGRPHGALEEWQGSAPLLQLSITQKNAALLLRVEAKCSDET
jgi:hypothetical protein